MYCLSIILTVLATYFLSSYLPEPTTIIPWIAQSASPLEVLTQTVVPSTTSHVVEALESIPGSPEPPRFDRNICEPVMFDSSDHATHDSIYRKTVCRPIPLPSRSEKLVAYTKYAIQLLKYAKDVALSTSSNSFLAGFSLSVILNILFAATFSSLWHRSSKRATRISHLEDTNVKLNKNEAALKKHVEALKGNPKERQTEVHSSQRILQLTMERDDLKYKCSSLSLTCDDLRAERQELRNSTIRRSCFERRLEVFERAKAAAREKQIKIEELEKSLQDQIAIVREQNVNLQARDETIEVTMTDLETAKETMRRQRTALAREQQKIQSLSAELSALQDELKTELEDFATEKVGLTTLYDKELQTEREAFATEKTALIVAHEKELRKERRGFATEKAALVAAHRKELQELQTEKIELLAYETECLELRDVLSEKQEKLDALLAENTDLDNKNQILRLELSQMKKNQEESEERIQKLQQNLSQMKQNKEKSEDRVQQLQEESKTIQEERDAEQEELTAAYEEMDKLENDRNSMSRTLEGVKAVCCEAAFSVSVESYARQFFASLSGAQPGRRSRATRARCNDCTIPLPDLRDVEDEVFSDAVGRAAPSTVCSQAVIHIPTSSRALVLAPRKLFLSKEVALSSWSSHIETTRTLQKIMALLMIEHMKATLSKYRLSPQTHIEYIRLPLSLDCTLSTADRGSASALFIGPALASSDDAQPQNESDREENLEDSAADQGIVKELEISNRQDASNKNEARSEQTSPSENAATESDDTPEIVLGANEAATSASPTALQPASLTEALPSEPKTTTPLAVESPAASEQEPQSPIVPQSNASEDAVRAHKDSSSEAQKPSLDNEPVASSPQQNDTIIESNAAPNQSLSLSTPQEPQTLPQQDRQQPPQQTIQQKNLVSNTPGTPSNTDDTSASGSPPRRSLKRKGRDTTP